MSKVSISFQGPLCELSGNISVACFYRSYVTTTKGYVKRCREKYLSFSILVNQSFNKKINVLVSSGLYDCLDNKNKTATPCKNLSTRNLV